MPPLSKASDKQASWRVHEPQAAEIQRTIVVLGAARGGTSMIAGTLRVLGVPMGTNLNSSHENRAFRTALFGKNRLIDYYLLPVRFYTRYLPLLKNYNRTENVWGIKDPCLNPVLAWLAAYWRNPIYILVLRNPISTAESQSHHFKRPFTTLLARVLKQQQQLYQFAMSSKRPLLVISYEMALQYKTAVLDDLIAYCGLTVNSETYQAALAFMNDQKGYQWLVDAKANLLGFVEKVTPQEISGWGFNPQTTEPVTFALMYKKNEIARVQATGERPDVLNTPSFARLSCGFVFDVSHLTITSLNAIEVIEVNSSLPLQRIT